MTVARQCPECGAHFHAPDQASLDALLHAHILAEHGVKADEKTLAYIAGLESTLAELRSENEALKARQKRKDKQS
jgi:hypothetical protein